MGHHGVCEQGASFFISQEAAGQEKGVFVQDGEAAGLQESEGWAPDLKTGPWPVSLTLSAPPGFLAMH